MFLYRLFDFVDHSFLAFFGFLVDFLEFHVDFFESLVHHLSEFGDSSFQLVVFSFVDVFSKDYVSFSVVLAATPPVLEALKGFELFN